MSPDQVVRSYFDALEAKDLVRVDALISPDLVFITPLKPLSKHDLLGVFRSMLDAFPDWRFDHQEPVTTGDIVRARLRMSGTHTRTFVPPFPGLKPVKATGRKVVLPEQEFVYHVDRDRITRIVPEPVPGGGVPGLLQQIGVTLPPLWLLRIVMKVLGVFRRRTASA